jgi:flagellar biosynthesis/type III secretory pathway protein FliH
MWNQGELMEYERFKIAALDNIDALETAKKEGMQKGMQKGLKEGIEKGLKEGIEKGAYEAKVQMIKELHGDGIPLSSIIKATNLKKEEIERILHTFSY